MNSFIRNNLKLDAEIMYQALIEKDSQFEGIFYVGVKTTGIFCRPTCTARKPKFENTEYFESIKNALDFGYRPCKICKPLFLKDNPPMWITELIDEINNNPELKISDFDLSKRNIEPNKVRRWFKKNYGITFQAYQRSIRINKAFGIMRLGEKVTNAAFDQGYESLSGFNYTFKKSTGFSPNKSKNNMIITITRILTPLGPMLAGATTKGICLLEFTDRRMLETQLKRLNKMLKAEFITGEHKYFEVLNNQIKEYFEGKRRLFDVPLDIPGTDFQKKVWKLLMTIPYGETRSYKEQAIGIGNPKAVRAVAKANGDNRISIIIPCHRVIGSDGKLVGYGGGIWRKEYLLKLEKQIN